MAQGSFNIVLIGMPGSGKSTTGVILAKMTSRDFMDTDILIQTLHGRSLQEIVDTEGHMALRKIEEDVLLDLHCTNHVIATGGSAVYSHAAMTRLKSKGVVVFLDVDLPTLKLRINDFDMRGLAKHPDQSLSELFVERFPLYTKHADFTIKCDDLIQEKVSEKISSRIKKRDSTFDWKL